MRLPNLIGSYPTSFFVFEGLLWIALIGFPLLAFWAWKNISDSTIQSPLVWGSLFVWVCILYGAFIAPQRLVTRHITLPENDLPELKLVVLSDIHAGPYKGKRWVRKIVNKVNAIPEVDAVIILGDFLYGGPEKYLPELDPLGDLQYPTYFIRGNHDHCTRRFNDSERGKKVSSKLTELGLQELRNGNLFLKEKGIWLAGIDDNFSGYYDLSSAMKGIPERAKTILMAHSPDIVADFRQNELPDLILSGHTHGGQLRLPFFGTSSLVIPTRHKYHVRHLYHLCPKKYLFITSGVGEVGTRARFWCPPEIVVLETK